ncbi:hypothetical protein ACQP1V_36355 [Microtetraspora malaysiensis]|uniref:hypothetical protein n=1 Tax=Microtetraspora malaysiensis TaxID=161358 RepID=UPI003D90EDB7
MPLAATINGVIVDTHRHRAGGPHVALYNERDGEHIRCFDPHNARRLAAAILAAVNDQETVKVVPADLLLLALMGAFNDGRTSLDDYDGDDLLWLTDALHEVIPAINAATRRDVVAVLRTRASTVTYGQTTAEANAYAQGLHDGAALIELGRTA